MDAWIIWLSIGGILLVAEMLTLTVLFVYFGIGALAAAAVAAAGMNIYVQVIVFSLVSLIPLAVTRRAALAALRGRDAKTNVHAMIGRRVQAVSPDAVKIGGEIWTAHTVDYTPIEPGSVYNVVAVSGATVTVEPLPTS